jgi:hypothetical protein
VADLSQRLWLAHARTSTPQPDRDDRYTHLVIDGPGGWGLHCKRCHRSLIGSSDGEVDFGFIAAVANNHKCRTATVTVAGGLL